MEASASAGIGPYVLLALNAVLGLVTLFGGMWLRRMESDMADIRKALTEQGREVHDKLADKVGREDFREFRQELRENFSEIFTRMDSLRDRVAEKADRS